jgi:hypothetical protein
MAFMTDGSGTGVDSELTQVNLYQSQPVLSVKVQKWKWLMDINFCGKI